MLTKSTIFTKVQRKQDNHQYSVHVGDDFNENYSFEFISPWQKHLLLSSTSFCLDATHNTTTIDTGLLYTIVIRHAVSGAGCPVAFFYTTDKSSYLRYNF
jgi:hypothetical protein